MRVVLKCSECGKTQVINHPRGIGISKQFLDENKISCIACEKRGTLDVVEDLVPATPDDFEKEEKA